MSDGYLKFPLLTVPNLWVQWKTILGDTYQGIVQEMNDNVVVVLCDDDVTRCVEDYNIQASEFVGQKENECP